MSKYSRGGIALLVGGFLTALPVMDAPSRSSAVVWALCSGVLGGCLGFLLRNVRPWPAATTIVAICFAALIGQVMAKVLPIGPWDAGLGGFITGFVGIVAVTRREDLRV